METTYREHMYATSEWEYDCVDQNMVQSVQMSYKHSAEYYCGQASLTEKIF
jgi:hypothetical protein